MASEKVYVGKAGAQELYRRVEEHIDARIPKVPSAEGNVGKFTEDGSLEDAGVSAAELESAVRDDHTHENKEVLDATTAAYTTEEQEKLGNVEAGAEVNEIVTVKVDGSALTPDADRAVDIDLSGKVDKVDGKQLSTEDYTTAEKTKLGGIAEGAQVNVIETITVDNEPLTPTGKAVNIDLSGKVDKVTGKELSTNDYTDADQEKLEAIEGGAQVNVIETVRVAGTALEVTGKAVNIPYAGASVNGVVKLTDDPESVTENSAATPAAIRAALANFGGFMVVPLGQDGKPAVQNPSTKYIYLTKEDHSTKTDPYTEWIYIIPEQGEAHWDIIGEASVNPDNYVQKVDSAVEGNLASLTAGGSMDDSGISGTDVSDAVSKKHSHANKGVLDLVEEPYTTAEKTKLAGISNYVESASVSGRTLTLTPKTGEAVTFSDTGDVNVIESVSVAGTELDIENKAVNVPEAGGSTGAWVKGVVSGEDTARWDNWKHDENITIPLPKDTIEVKGHLFKYVQIGNLLWTTKNLDVEIGTLGSTCFWYNNSDTNKKYGMLYKLGALGSFEYVSAGTYRFVPTQDVADNIISQGWRIPTSRDYKNLITTIMGVEATSCVPTKLKSTSDWQTPGTDDYGFNALPSGYKNWNNNTTFYDKGNATKFWTSTFASYQGATGYGIKMTNTYFSSSADVYNPNYGLSVRLVKDVNA